MKKLLIFCCFLTLLLFTGCGTAVKQQPFIATTIYPLTDITRRICGEYLQVKQLVPPNVEPHEWDPSPVVMKEIDQAAFLVAIGPMLEPVAKLQTDQSKQLLMCNYAKTISNGESVDPHMWLDPQNVISFIPALVEKLIAVDGSHAEYYKSNAALLVKELVVLDKAYRDNLKSINKTEFVTTHAAFGYLANRYGLQQYSILGNTPEAEPSAKHLVQLAEFCKAHRITTIFFEPRESEKLAVRFANEIHAKIAPLDPLEMAPPPENDAQGYSAIMRKNLENLVSGMVD
ncbi:MAG: zinc ABC transporter substrate-binding protein [Bacillota bacterium]